MRQMMSYVASVHRALSFIVRFTLYIREMTGPALRLTYSLHERLTIVRFIAKLVLLRSAAVAARSLQHMTAHEDTLVSIQGVQYCVGLTSHEIAAFGEIWLSKSYEEFSDFVPERGSIVVDIGANVGLFAVRQALRGAQVYAVEPNPDCFRRLRRTIEINDLGSHIHTLESAIGSTAGQGRIVAEGGVTLVGTLVTNKDGEDSAANVAVMTLDALCAQLHLTHIDLLKIDTEGAESDILRGATQTLSLVDRIVLEYHSHQLLQNVKNILVENRFVIRHVAVHDNVQGIGLLFANKEQVHGNNMPAPL